MCSYASWTCKCRRESHFEDAPTLLVNARDPDMTLVLTAVDVVVIVTNHEIVNEARVVNLASLVVDTRHATAIPSAGQGARRLTHAPYAPAVRDGLVPLEFLHSSPFAA